MNIECEFCKQAEKEIINYKNGYGEKYEQNVVNEIAALRDKLCIKSQTCEKENCFAKKLISLIDNDCDIKRKKGLK